MTVQLGIFTMPFHHPDRDYATILNEDREAVVLADQLGYSEFFVGEHFSSWSERITSPLIFLASVIDRTKRIKLGTGVINLPQLHPATVAAHAAMFDQLAGGRFIMGIGPGGLVSDLELFAAGAPELRPQMVLESIDMVLKLWASDPPYDLKGKFWNLQIKNGIWPDFKVGWVPRPLQQPHPPIAISLVTPNSSSAKTAGERGWIPISGNFFNKRFLRGHWEKYVEGCEIAGRKPDPSVWRVARCVLACETDAEAEDYIAATDTGMQYYYSFFQYSMAKGRNALFMLKDDDKVSDAATTVDAIKRSQVIFGSPKRVLDQLVALREETGPFGTLLMTGHDWDRPKMWQRSMQLMATEVMPRLNRHALAAE